MNVLHLPIRTFYLQSVHYDEGEPERHALAVDKDGAQRQDPGQAEHESEDGVEEEPQLENGHLLALFVLRFHQPDSNRFSTDPDFASSLRSFPFKFGFLGRSNDT